MKYYCKLHVAGPVWIKVYAGELPSNVIGTFKVLRWRIIYPAETGLDYRTMYHERQHARDFLNPLTWFRYRLSFKARRLYKEARAVVAESYYGDADRVDRINYMRRRSPVIATTTGNTRTDAAIVTMRQDVVMARQDALRWKS